MGDKSKHFSSVGEREGKGVILGGRLVTHVLGLARSIYL